MMTTKQDIVRDLERRGPRFHGEDSSGCAQEWLDEGFADDATDWMDAGFWCPATARRVKDMGVKPDEVAALCNDNVTGYDDPVYAMCNSDLSVDALKEG